MRPERALSVISSFMGMILSVSSPVPSFSVHLCGHPIFVVPAGSITFLDPSFWAHSQLMEALLHGLIRKLSRKMVSNLYDHKDVFEFGCLERWFKRWSMSCVISYEWDTGFPERFLFAPERWNSQKVSFWGYLLTLKNWLQQIWDANII